MDAQKSTEKEILGYTTVVSEEKSKRITSLRFILILCILFIHNPIYVQNPITKWGELIIHFGIANSAVPLFFYVLGLYWGNCDYPLFDKFDNIKWYDVIPFFLFTFIAFFLYAIHLFINDTLFGYFTFTILTVTIGIGIGIILKKILPKTFSILNGGR